MNRSSSQKRRHRPFLPDSLTGLDSTFNVIAGKILLYRVNIFQENFLGNLSSQFVNGDDKIDGIYLAS
jgi:hypothetical protein